jgi:ADP-ribose pyrophosphatase YjhB (NUDIX family)
MPPTKIRDLENKYGRTTTVTITRNLSNQKKQIKTQPQYGAFAIIRTKHNEFIFQRQSYEQHNVTRDDWMVPGGKLEKDESFEDAVTREVREETGMDIEIAGLYKIFHHINHYQEGPEEWYLAVFHANLVSEAANHSSPEVLEIGRFKELPEHFMGELKKYYLDLE